MAMINQPWAHNQKVVKDLVVTVRYEVNAIEYAAQMGNPETTAKHIAIFQEAIDRLKVAAPVLAHMKKEDHERKIQTGVFE